MYVCMYVCQVIESMVIYVGIQCHVHSKDHNPSTILVVCQYSMTTKIDHIKILYPVLKSIFTCVSLAQDYLKGEAML